jgi:elongation factor Ts
VVTAEMVRELRERTGAGMMECKKALVESNGNFDQAVEALRKSGIAKAEKRSERGASEGLVEAYIHPGNRVGVLIEVNCETDFVAKNENFRELVKDISLHIAAANPKFLRREEVPADLIAKEREIAAEQVKGKPANIVDKIVDGKIDKIFAEQCLLEQAFIKNPDMTIGDLVKSKIAELGENLVVRRFVRYAVGEELAA